jgi:hypothetical protein
VKGALYHHTYFTDVVELPNQLLPPNNKFDNQGTIFAVMGKESLAHQLHWDGAMRKAATVGQVKELKAVPKSEVRPQRQEAKREEKKDQAASSSFSGDLVASARQDLAKTSSAKLDGHASSAIGLELMQDSKMDDVDVIALSGMFGTIGTGGRKVVGHSQKYAAYGVEEQGADHQH